MRLLIADSDPLVLKSLRICLRDQKDFVVMGLIADSMDAIEICRADEPDVVLLDARLDGVATTQQIKSLCPNIQVIMLTTFGDTPEVRRAIIAGAKGYIVKADKISSIVEKIRTMIFA